MNFKKMLGNTGLYKRFEVCKELMTFKIIYQEGRGSGKQKSSPDKIR